MKVTIKRAGLLTSC